MCLRFGALARGLIFTLPWVFLPVAVHAGDHPTWQLAITDRNSHTLARISLPASGQWCLVWNHSVQGFPVIDCFRAEGRQLVLDSSQTPDFAAGLGYTPGRGTLESDHQHGYRIVDMNVPITNNTLRLRVGSVSVNHRIKVDARTVSLSHLAANERVDIRLVAVGAQGTEFQ